NYSYCSRSGPAPVPPATATYRAPHQPDQALLGLDRCLVIGDTPHDVASAHAAGVACVGVATHKYNSAQLAEAKADWVIESFEDGLPHEALE
ncbi:HAD hydrolase-like protein, partial [Streptomyces sp. NPDC005969]|uniref:HAD family hydrolase n=1 Tax=Streptomyces sp. NPDC005969 TaxID=3156722 RepID=UPI0033F65DD8